MASIRRSLLVNFLSTNGVAAIHFCVTLVLARCLNPEEVGVYSMAAVLTAIAHLFRDFGVGAYLQREETLTSEKVANAFGVLLVTSWAMAGVLLLASWPASAYFGIGGLKAVLWVQAAGFLFIPFGAVTHSLMTRDYRAVEQNHARMAGNIAYAVTAIGLALQGFSYMSMAWANLVNIVVTALAYLPYRPRQYSPWPRLNRWREVVSFGAGSTLGNSIQALNNAFPDIVLGKVSGAHDVGLFSRAQGVNNILDQVLGPTVGYAVLPVLSRLHHRGEALGAQLGKACAYITGVMWPALVGIAFFVEPLISLLYGTQWLGAAQPARWLALMLALNVPFTFHAAAYMAVGQPMLMVWPTLLSLLARGLAAMAWYDGSLTSFAQSMCLAALVTWPAHLYFQRRCLGWSAVAFFAALGRSATLVAVTATLAWVVSTCTRQWAESTVMAVATTLLVPTWCWAIWGLRHPLREELELLIARLRRKA